LIAVDENTLPGDRDFIPDRDSADYNDCLAFEAA
jgi:hypothetical protein